MSRTGSILLAFAAGTAIAIDRRTGLLEMEDER
jgi:hypothetical protein